MHELRKDGIRPVKGETADYLAKARVVLADARQMWHCPCLMWPHAKHTLPCFTQLKVISSSGPAKWQRPIALCGANLPG
jgi:hypothetical protein